MDGRYNLIVSFPDESGSFVHGFEAGLIWARMEAGQMEIDSTVHEENREVIERMARRKGYVFDRWERTSVDGWADVTLRKTAPESHLRAVPLRAALTDGGHDG